MSSNPTSSDHRQVSLGLVRTRQTESVLGDSIVWLRETNDYAIQLRDNNNRRQCRQITGNWCNHRADLVSGGLS